MVLGPPREQFTDYAGLRCQYGKPGQILACAMLLRLKFAHSARVRSLARCERQADLHTIYSIAAVLFCACCAGPLPADVISGGALRGLRKKSYYVGC